MPLPMMVPATIAVACQTFSSRTSSGRCRFTGAAEAMVVSLVCAKGFRSTYSGVFDDRPTPAFTQLLILPDRKLHQHRPARRIEPCNQRLQVRLRHGRASHSRLSRAAPDMHKDTRAGAGLRWRRVVLDQDTPAIKVVGAQHVLGAVPIRRHGAAVDDLVVKLRGGIVDALN